jgi:hypothetical protein
MEREPLSCAATLENRAAHGSEPASGQAPNIEKRPARTSAGRSSSDLGGEPRGPNDIRSSHNAVILASATTGLRVGAPLPASAERLSSPNSVSANRRSISCCSRARASSVVAHGGNAGAETQNLALTPMRFDARTTAGAQTASDARPRRNWRRGTISEPIFRIPPLSADEYNQPVAAAPSPTRTAEARISFVLFRQRQILTALPSFVDIPNRGSSVPRCCAARYNLGWCGPALALICAVRSGALGVRTGPSPRERPDDRRRRREVATTP